MPFDLVEAARELIAIDSVSARGNLGLVPVLRRCAAQVGLELEVLEEVVEGARHANLLFRRPQATGSGEPLLLLTHTDTVAPGPLDRWTEAGPFAPAIAGDKLYGLGSADVKPDLLCKLLAVERLATSALRRDVFVLGTYGEEIGLLGAKSFARQGPVRPRFVVCGEPSELSVIHAHKGYLVARVTLGQRRAGSAASRTETFKGKAAHSSTPHLGENAIQKALAQPLTGAVGIHGGQGANSVPAECVVEFSESADGARPAGTPAPPGGSTLPLAEARLLARRFAELVAALAPARDERFAPPTTVTNLGFIDGREGQLEMLLDARLLPGHDPETLAQVFGEEVHAAGGRIVFERANPAVYTDPAGELCRAALHVCERLGLRAALQTKATNTEAAAFAGQAEAIVFGPGPSVGNAHCPNEYTLVSQLRTAVDWYEGLIRELCG